MPAYNGSEPYTYLDPCANFTNNFAAPVNRTRDSGSMHLLSLVNIYYGIVYAVGMSGNLLVMFVVLRYSKMHTVTNFFILSLALADVCFLWNMPFLMVTTFKESWIFGNFYCKIFYSMTTVNQFASSFFLLVMSADRYFAVCHAIRSNKYRTAQAAVVVCSIVWITSIILMIPVFIYSGDIHGTCGINWPGSEHVNGMQAFTLYCLVLGFAFPLLLIVAFYTMVIRKVRTLGPKTIQGTNGTSGTNEVRKRSHRKVTVMVLVVISAYIICWLPYWIAQVILVYTSLIVADDPEVNSQCKPPVELDPETRRIVVGIVVVLQALCYTNSSVNPILYAMLSENFKKSFAAACCGRRADMERMSLPEPSIYMRSRNMAGSIRRKFFSTYEHDDDEDEDSPATQKTSMEASSRRSTTVHTGRNSLRAPSLGMIRNGSVCSTNSHTSHHNGYQLVVKRDNDEEAV